MESTVNQPAAPSQPVDSAEFARFQAWEKAQGASPRLHADQPTSHTPEVIAALVGRGDQEQTGEIQVAPNLSIALGIRHVYFNFDGQVVICDIRPAVEAT